jgi:hypothetical protein
LSGGNGGVVLPSFFILKNVGTSSVNNQFIYIF